MADQTFEIPGILQPFLVPAENYRVPSALPFAQCVFQGSVSVDAGAQNDVRTLNFNLPDNFAYRLTHFNIRAVGNGGSPDMEWLLQYVHSWSANETIPAQEEVFRGLVETSGDNAWYVIGVDADASGGAMLTSFSGSPTNQIITKTTDVDAPYWTMTNNAASTASTVYYNLTYLAYTLDQRHHVAVHVPTPVIQ